jgi:hypothetical protein
MRLSAYGLHARPRWRLRLACRTRRRLCSRCRGRYRCTCWSRCTSGYKRRCWNTCTRCNNCRRSSRYKRGGLVPALCRRVVAQALFIRESNPAVVVLIYESHRVCPYQQVLHRVVCEEIRVHLLPNGHFSGIPIRLATLTTVRIKAHELLHFATVQASILPPPLSHRRSLCREHEILPLGNVVELDEPMIVDRVHLADSAVLYLDVSPAPGRHGRRRQFLSCYSCNAYARDAIISKDRPCIQCKVGRNTRTLLQRHHQRHMKRLYSWIRQNRTWHSNFYS